MTEQNHFLLVDDLQVKALAFIDYYNRTMANLFKWMYQDKALTV